MSLDFYSNFGHPKGHESQWWLYFPSSHLLLRHHPRLLVDFSLFVISLFSSLFNLFFSIFSLNYFITQSFEEYLNPRKMTLWDIHVKETVVTLSLGTHVLLVVIPNIWITLLGSNKNAYKPILCKFWIQSSSFINKPTFNNQILTFTSSLSYALFW